MTHDDDDAHTQTTPALPDEIAGRCEALASRARLKALGMANAAAVEYQREIEVLLLNAETLDRAAVEIRRLRAGLRIIEKLVPDSSARDFAHGLNL